jgi:hypothetical protein
MQSVVGVELTSTFNETFSKKVGGNPCDETVSQGQVVTGYVSEVGNIFKVLLAPSSTTGNHRRAGCASNEIHGENHRKPIRFDYHFSNI